MRRDPGAWSRQPVVWLGALILAGSIVGCVVMIVVAFQFADDSVDTHGDRAMNVPVQRSAASGPSNR